LSASFPIRPFAEKALDYAQRGPAVIRCPGDDGKSPRGAIAGYHRWKKAPGPRSIRKFAVNWGDANIGIIPSLSGLTVADVDEGGKDAEKIIRRAGDTPLIIGTPSGGLHLYYRSNGERSSNLRSAGFSVDVRGSSAGIIIVPPSFRRSDCVPYKFERGNWDDLDRLPYARPGSLSMQYSGSSGSKLLISVVSGITNCSRPHFVRSVTATIPTLSSTQLQRS
jgi:hypothetical protein